MIKKIAIAVSFMVFCAGSFDAFGSKRAFDDLSDEGEGTTITSNTPSVAPSIIYQIPEDVLKLIILEMFKTTNPCSLTSVCKSWHRIIRENNAPKPGLKFSTLNPFLKDGIKTWWNNEGKSTNLGLFFNSQLLENLGTTKEKIYQFSFFDNPFKGTIELSFTQQHNYYDSIFISRDTEVFILQQHVSYDNCAFTADPRRFIKIGDRNESNSVILVALRQQVEQESKNDPNYFLAKFLATWKKEATMGLFFRWGNCVDLNKIDYLTSATLSDISSRNLYENWEQSTKTSIPGQASLSPAAERLHIRFNLNNDI